MIEALFSFLGGSVFRMAWGEIAAWLNKKQDHQYEIERMRLQADLDDRRHQREQDAIKTQAALQVEVIRVQGEQALNELDAQTFIEGVKATTILTGVRWVDAWNQTIRPGVATWAVVMLTVEAFSMIELSDGTLSVCFAALGLYLADRTLAKRGK